VRLKTLGYDNVTVIVGDGMLGAPDKAPYDRILVTAAATEVPQALTEQLADGGIMLLPLGPHPDAQTIVKVSRTGDEIARENLLAVRFVPLLPGRAREL
jgi:protein-L-isoaspartate(D-aspartate) O-methyltransferase